MCGINGFSFSDLELIGKMNRLTEHRGPDATDFWVGDGISLGHDRLAIIDLSPRGGQPMWDSKREVVIVYNGEIYNYLELRDELKKDYEFQSDSDTEVILSAYKKYGADCVKKFNGMFAFAIWDTRTRELFLARDHIGIIPLYYYHDGNKFIFSSEIKAILAHEEVPRKVDKRAFNLYFQLLYVPQPYTMFEGVRKLPPATSLIYKEGKIAISSYWNPTNFSDYSGRKEAEEEIINLFEDSVQRQLVSDRPVGVFLSGGIDSTAVLGAVCQGSEKQAQTFSVGFKDSTDPKKFNADFELARMTAKYYGTRHHELLVGPEDVAANLERIAWHMDEPNSNPTALPMFLLSQMAKREVAVVLGGDGGDELFGGYPRYHASRLISLYQKFPVMAQIFGRNMLRAFGKNDLTRKLTLPANHERIIEFLAQKSGVVSNVVRDDVYESGASLDYLKEKYFSIGIPTSDFERYFMNVDRQSWLVDESLLRTNKMCLAFGLEPRVPILDLRLVELSLRLPTAWKFSAFQRPDHFQGKDIWREAVLKFLPEHIVNERKRGWFTPMAKWLRTDNVGNLVTEILGPDRLNSEFFNQKEVYKIWTDHRDRKTYNLNIIWAIVMWQLWHDRFIP